MSAEDFYFKGMKEFTEGDFEDAIVEFKKLWRKKADTSMPTTPLVSPTRS